MKTVASVALLLFAYLVTTTNPALSQESTRADFEEFCKAMEGRWVGKPNDPLQDV